jgi:hypothetical protein
MMRRALSGLVASLSFVSVLMAMLAVVALAAAAAPALAARAHVFEGSFGEEGEGPGQLKEPAGVAVNEASGDVYVVDIGSVGWRSAPPQRFEMHTNGWNEIETAR